MQARWGVPLTEWGFSQDVITKAYEHADAVIGPVDAPRSVSVPDYRVAGSACTYVVNVGIDPVAMRLWWCRCSCPHGLRTGTSRVTCYHVAALLIHLMNEAATAAESKETQ
jgi:hypothetical protein